MQRAFSDGTDRIWRQSFNPFTNSLIVASVVIFLCSYAGVPLASWLYCSVPEHLAQPWRMVTYPLVPGGIIGLLFNGLMLWWAGGSLERSWGTRAFALFYCLVCVVTALSFLPAALFFAGGMVPGRSIAVDGYLVFGAVFVTWCMLNPDETIMVYGIVPVKSRYLALAVTLIIFFTHGMGNPLLGLLALGGCAFGYLWVRQGWSYQTSAMTAPLAPRFQVPNPFNRPRLRLVPRKPARPADDRFTIRDLNPIEWIARKRRQRKFERLMRDD